MSYLRYRIAKLTGALREAKQREERHLETIRKLSMDSIHPEEAEEMRGQMAALIAEVGTLRARLKLQPVWVVCADGEVVERAGYFRSKKDAQTWIDTLHEERRLCWRGSDYDEVRTEYYPEELQPALAAT